MLLWNDIKSLSFVWMRRLWKYWVSFWRLVVKILSLVFFTQLWLHALKTNYEGKIRPYLEWRCYEAIMAASDLANVPEWVAADEIKLLNDWIKSASSCILLSCTLGAILSCYEIQTLTVEVDKCFTSEELRGKHKLTLRNKSGIMVQIKWITSSFVEKPKNSCYLQSLQDMLVNLSPFIKSSFPKITTEFAYKPS